MPRFPRWWFLAAFATPAAVTAIGLALQVAGIERAVEAAARKAAGQGEVVVDGRDVTVSGVPVEQTAKVATAVDAASGVRQVSIVEPRLPPIRLKFTPAGITVTGSTEQEAWRRQFVQALTRHLNGRKLVDETKAVKGTDFPITTKAAEVVVALLSRQPEETAVTVTPDKLTLTGTIPDEKRRTAIITAFKRLFGDKAVVDQTKTKE
ncbi:hypothetical protein KIPE111705_17675 [Kibdelosporangium persicum]|uniref:BON domain-containing protein n=1 Tax=Kibdelosporangium persicum TaxID=2698649 RepID=A0ABX2F4W1_9PSEU|nr:hypothetical protein [Kibdelosporangium persicum]NRN65850.1 BON domain-containing protein [Kibdelosporangium persicum]